MKPKEYPKHLPVGKVYGSLLISMNPDRQDEFLDLWIGCCEPQILAFIQDRDAKGIDFAVQTHIDRFIEWTEENGHLLEQGSAVGLGARLFNAATIYVLCMAQYGLFDL